MRDRILETLLVFLAICQPALSGCYGYGSCYSGWWSSWYFWCILIGILACCCGSLGECYRRKRLATARSGMRGPVVTAGAPYPPGQAYNNAGMIMSPSDPSGAPYPGVYSVPPPYAQTGPTMAPPAYDDVIKTPPYAVPPGFAPPTPSEQPHTNETTSTATAPPVATPNTSPEITNQPSTTIP